MSENTQPSRQIIARRRNAREQRTRIVDEGGRRLELLLDADAAKALAQLQGAGGVSARTVISRLLLQAVKNAR